MKKSLEYYKKLQYPIRIEADPEGGFLASHPDLEGCFGFGETPPEALEDLEDSKDLWLECYYAAHKKAPEPPQPKREYSGKFLLRVPKFLHQRLDESASAEGVSLNQYILTLVSERNSLKMAARLFERNQLRLEMTLRAELEAAEENSRIYWEVGGSEEEYRHLEESVGGVHFAAAGDCLKFVAKQTLTRDSGDSRIVESDEQISYFPCE